MPKHEFSTEQPLRSETAGYVKKPSLKNKMHCVVFMVDASKLSSYPTGLSTTFQQLRQHITDLVREFKGQTDTIGRAGELLCMPISSIIPVKNYCSELDVDMNTDVLLLSAVDHILQYVDLYYEDNKPTVLEYNIDVDM
ncbi:interferon-induced protein 44-like [Lampris incognitus]|uniref:interferon-induced protein 44-like n=1 Tax=Lampris incognitus TaxID=2546036 RepID=UPI0024B5B7A5|nr:interferon-induced protein 44-like [Lampris incognitus]